MSLAAKSSDSIKGNLVVPSGTKLANAGTKPTASTLQSTASSAKTTSQTSYAPRTGTAAGIGAPRSVSIKSVKSISGSLDSLHEKTTAAPTKSFTFKSQAGSSQLASQPISANRRRASLNLAQAVTVSSTSTSATAMPDIQNSTATHASSSISAPVPVSSSVAPVSILRTKTPPTANTNTNANLTLTTQATNVSSASQSSTTSTVPVSIMRAKTPPSATQPPTSATTSTTIPTASNTSSTSLKSTIPSHRTKYTSSATRTLQTAPSPPTTRRTSAIAINNHTRISSGATTGAASSATAASHAARVAAAAAAASQQHRRITSSMRGNGLMSAVELQRMPGSGTSGGSGAPSSGHSLGILSANDVDTNGMMRVASAPVERKRITFAPDVVGGAGDDMDLIPKRVSLGLRKPVSSGSSSHAAVLADLANAASDAKSSSPHESPRASTTTTSTTRADLQTMVTEQSQRIAELELKLKESERREQVAVKEKAAAVKELELNKKFMASDIKSVDQLKTQLQEEHQTNASLIIFNRSLKTQVAELEGIIEGLLAQKGASALDINAIMAKIESHKPIMPKISK
ncbi:hypothetical protein HDU81_000895 [Chytriomyces hyalinus]|nr:hypothetical protein HDU81_000895 [Chytriomyces hyalinus]